ncbi:amino acid permease/ SLC12A domain-containing protein [Leucosporidium creatinivorum]|uniref:Amino acid permease/ SLC12A domain-containing protein n=1 Tax=Leucosporidium creatinivorum TaxID=106004 RepID=A0A1Y2CAK6_9BASI|nr:amino acid permease/ SLC12A domain-containing protein [Leucosporidium creatinivorum]
MIAIGGTIGTGLFLGTGRSLATGGPGSLLINYSIVGGIVLLVMLCLGEMATEFPLAGSFTTYSARFVDEPFGFAIGWNYCFNDAISTAGDLTAAQVLMDYWLPNGHLNWLPSLFFLFFLVGINLIHVRAYGELEYWLSLLKIVTIVIFFFLGIAVNAGGNVDHEYIGARNWTLGAAPFVGGFGGFASLFVTASFAYGGTESIGITAGETANPRRNIPRVIKRVFARILIFYILTVVLIGFNVPYDYPNLSTKTTATSPFTIIFAQAGSTAGGSFMNTVILTSVLSAGNHALFAGARVLYGLAVINQAPAVFKKTNRNQVPWVAVLAVASVSLLFFGASFLPGGAGEIWTWCQNLVGVSNQLAWWCIGVASWRFRRAWVTQGRSVNELGYPAPSWAAPTVVLSVTFIILVQGWSSFAPFDAVSFVASYIELPVFLVLYLGWRLIKRSRTSSLKGIDLDTGRFVNSAVEEADDADVQRRESGKFGWAWKMYSWVA